MALYCEIVFWSCLAAALYAYTGYPIVLAIASKTLRRKLAPPEPVPNDPQEVVVLVAAYNEEQTIEEKIRNTLELDYPHERLKLVIASDGSGDSTVEVVARWAAMSDRVHLLDYKERRGKAAVLNSAIAEMGGEILVLSDANTLFDRHAVRNLVRWFANPEVNTVCGRLVLRDPESGNNVDSLYWRYETFLKIREAQLGALLGANGAIYAIRRSAYVPIPDNTIIDDFVIPLLGKIHNGGRIVYDRDAVATEDTPPRIANEMCRRIRIGAGGYQSLRYLWPLLNPAFGWTWFAFVSHKLLRWIVPFLLAGMFVANLCLMEVGPYQAMLALQVGFLAAAAFGVYLPGNSIVVRLLRTAAMFIGMNYALARGFFRWLFIEQRGVWQRTER